MYQELKTQNYKPKFPKKSQNDVTFMNDYDNSLTLIRNLEPIKPKEAAPSLDVVTTLNAEDIAKQQNQNYKRFSQKKNAQILKL